MDTDKTGRINSIHFIFTIGIIAGVEAGIYYLPFEPLVRTGVARCMEIVFIFWLFNASDAGLAAIGLSKELRLPGFKKGLIWSAGFGFLAVLAGIVLFCYGINPFKLFHAGLPSTRTDLVLFYIIGGLIAPVAEEIFFRGVIYGYARHLLEKPFRQWSVPIALVISTALFVMAHQGGTGIALPQLVGGIVFCLSYEMEKSLITPMVIHSTGNLALFTISFL
jgi:membrane protease YdiL (CAAX protease family)